jgi:hypothetical protein
LLFSNNILNSLFGRIVPLLIIRIFNFERSILFNKLINSSDNSEHLLLYNLYKYIESNKDSGIFNLELFDSIQNAYSRQIEKLKSLYERFDIKLDEIKKKDFNTNIIKSLAYGYKSNRAFKSLQGFKLKY